jgi:dTMP kinase
VIRSWLADGAHVEPRALLGLYLADRAQHVAQVIRPALQRGAVVVCDRYRASTLAYQGGGAAVFDVETVDELDRALGSGGLEPDLTLLLDLPPLASASRVRRRGGAPDHFEAQDLAWRARVRETYLSLAAAAPDAWHIIDACGSAARVAAHAADVVLHALTRRGASGAA